MAAGSQTVVNSVRPLKIGGEIGEKIGENQEKIDFFKFWGPKIDFNPPFHQKINKKNFGAQKSILTRPPPKKFKKFANDMNITQLPHPIQMALAQKINLIKI